MNRGTERREWWCRKKHSRAASNAYVYYDEGCDEAGQIGIRVLHGEGNNESVFVDKRLARILATRILDALDDINSKGGK